jgi:hypothetical protein
MKRKSKKKENVQHVVRDPAKEADWGTAIPFVNPLFYIIGSMFNYGFRLAYSIFYWRNNNWILD